MQRVDSAIETGSKDRIPIALCRRAAIFDELARMLSHPAFNKSDRCKDLLRYLVENAADNQELHIKERVLGAEVFGRPVDYDTALDPIVRMTVNEVRKRIAQYGQDRQNAGEWAEVRIELPMGTYTPAFLFHEKNTLVAQESVRQFLASDALEPTPTKTGRHWLHRRLFGVVPVLATAAAVLALCGIGAITLVHRSSNFDLFWAPLLATPNRVMVGIGDTQNPLTNSISSTLRQNAPGSASTAADPDHSTISLQFESKIPILPMPDVAALSAVSGVLKDKKKAFIVRPSKDVKAFDMHDGPAILIGGFNNAWSLAAQSGLRFQSKQDLRSGTGMIVDTQNPQFAGWKLGIFELPEAEEKDYALVSRYLDQATGREVLALTGLGVLGTSVAAQFVSTPEYLNAQDKQFTACINKNMQIVLEAPVVGGIPGPPYVVATHCW